MGETREGIEGGAAFPARKHSPQKAFFCENEICLEYSIVVFETDKFSPLRGHFALAAAEIAFDSPPRTRRYPTERSKPSARRPQASLASLRTRGTALELPAARGRPPTGPWRFCVAKKKFAVAAKRRQRLGYGPAGPRTPSHWRSDSVCRVRHARRRQSLRRAGSARIRARRRRDKPTRRPIGRPDGPGVALPAGRARGPALRAALRRVRS